MSRPNIHLTVSSLLTMLFLMLHLTDEIARGMESGGTGKFSVVLILGVWLIAALLLPDRRLGLVIMFLGGLLGSGVPYIHMKGAGLVGGRVAHTSGLFFWVWTLLAMGATGILSLVLSALALWRSPWRPQR